MKKLLEFDISTVPYLKDHILEFSKEFKHCCILNSNNYKDEYGSFEYMAAIGAHRLLESEENSFDQLKAFHDKKKSWLFGHFSYDLKNELEDLQSKNPTHFSFSKLCFFEPEFLFLQKKGTSIIELLVHKESTNLVLANFLKTDFKTNVPNTTVDLSALSPLESKEEYLNAIKGLKREIQLGNIYEINYCTNFYAEGIKLEPTAIFKKLNDYSPVPFAAFYKQKENILMCASPERFLCKKGDQIISQPIKGTAKRGESKLEDETIKTALKEDLKEQTENVMIVDLVRNDLSRTAKKSSVKVEELFGAYTFPQVHQLISTVSSKLSASYHFTDAIKMAFPMGSMTGAPKISAMKLADKYEKHNREVYSGAVGYTTPEGDFDFNVVIRSLLYSVEKEYLSLTVGGAITALSEPEKEYEECLLKAKAIFDL